MDPLMELNSIIVVVTTILLIGLVWSYVGLARQVRNRLTMGLVTFSLLLWIQNLVQLFFIFTMTEYYTPNVQPLILVQNLLAMFATLSLTWTVFEPKRRARLQDA